MSDAPVQKAKKAAKPKKPASHPKYSDMIKAAIKNLKERGGSSRQAIAKYIAANYKVDAAKVNQHLKLALRAGVKNGSLKQAKGTGASGSFKLSETEKKPKAKKPKAAAKKPKAKKPAGEKKPKAKKVKTPKKKAAAKPKKSPAKKAAKPKKAKSPAKKAAKKTKSPKKAKAAKK